MMCIYLEIYKILGKKGRRYLDQALYVYNRGKNTSLFSLDTAVSISKFCIFRYALGWTA